MDFEIDLPDKPAPHHLKGYLTPPLALQHLADQITGTEPKHPDSLLIILGDFIRANLSHELPKYRQHVKCPTRDKNTLDNCYTVLKNAYVVTIKSFQNIDIER